jgi:adenosine deaminase
LNQLDGREVCRAVLDAVPEGLEVRLFIGIHHNGYTDYMGPMLEESLTWPELSGYDLHGTETFPLEPWTARLWDSARRAGKFTKAHAGEFAGPDFIRRVLNELGVTRLEHGVRAVEDPQLVEELARRGIVLDVCPWSNIKLGVAPSFREHPLNILVPSGVKCTINRDDPVSFGTTLAEEYKVLQDEMGFSDDVILVWYGTDLTPPWPMIA